MTTTATSDDARCWQSRPRVNLALQSSALLEKQRCSQRFATLEAAQAACEQLDWCRGVSRDAGLACGPTRAHLLYELRTSTEGEAVWLDDGNPVASWVLHVWRGGLRNATRAAGWCRRLQRRRLGAAGPSNASIPSTLIFNYRVNLLAASHRLMSAPERRLANNVRRTIGLFPDIPASRVVFFDDAQCRAALLRVSAELGPPLARRFDHERDGRLRSDMCRLAQLHAHGGYYFDTDIALRFDVRTLIEPTTSFVTCTTTTAFPQNPSGFFQAFVGASAGHPLLELALKRHLRWYEAKAAGDRAEIYRVTHNNHQPNVGTVLLRDAFVAWAGGAALEQAGREGLVQHAGAISAHASQLFFENRYYELGVGFETPRLASSPLCAFVVADRRSRKVPLVSRVYDQNARVPCLPSRSSTSTSKTRTR